MKNKILVFTQYNLWLKNVQRFQAGRSFREVLQKDFMIIAGIAKCRMPFWTELAGVGLSGPIGRKKCLKNASALLLGASAPFELTLPGGSL